MPRAKTRHQIDEQTSLKVVWYVVAAHWTDEHGRLHVVEDRFDDEHSARTRYGHLALHRLGGRVRRRGCVLYLVEHSGPGVIEYRALAEWQSDYDPTIRPEKPLDIGRITPKGRWVARWQTKDPEWSRVWTSADAPLGAQVHERVGERHDDDPLVGRRRETAGDLEGLASSLPALPAGEASS